MGAKLGNGADVDMGAKLGNIEFGECLS